MAFGAYQYGYQPNYPGQQMYGNQYPQYGQQAQPPMQPPMQTPAQNGLNRVTGMDGARAFAVNPNSVVALFDDTQDVFYIKTTDSGGFPTIKGYRFTPIEDAPQVQSTGLTRADVEQIVREEMQKHEQQFIPRQYTVPTEHRGGNTAGHDSGVRQLYAGDEGAQPGSDTQRHAQQRQTPAGGTAAGTTDGTAV